MLRISLADMKCSVSCLCCKGGNGGCSLPEDAHAPHVFLIAPLVYTRHTRTEKCFSIHKIHTLHRDESVFIVGGEDVKEYSKFSL